MNPRTILSVLALAGALASLPAHAADNPATQDPQRLPFPYGEGAPSASPSTTQERILEGEVTAIDRDSGRLVLRTSQGLVDLVASPQDVANIDVGDVIQVALAAR